MTNIFYLSLETVIFPHKFKEGQVTPLFKKSSPPKSDLKNYRHILNLSFLSKIKMWYLTACNFISAKNKFEKPLQSAYYNSRKINSTESALQKVQNVIAISPDKGQVTA